MNKLLITGNLTAEPTTGATASGKSVCNFTVAVNEGYGETQRTTFFHVAAWEKRGENCQRYLHKGSKVLVTGTVQTRAYKTSAGEMRASLEVNAQEVEFLSSPKTENSQQSAPSLTAVPTPDDLPF